jgi:hypothetical protein
VNPYSNGLPSHPVGPVNSSSYQGPYSHYTAPVRHILNNQTDLHGRCCISKAEVEFISMNRLLWMEHVNWTRMTIMGIVFGLPDLQFVQERLLRNATDFGNSLRPFYGDKIADRYEVLIKEHLVLAAELVTAAAKGDAKTAEEKEKQWYRNADDIADFLSSINPYLEKEEVREMFYTHLALTKLEAVNMLQKNYKAGIEVFDEIEAQALEMSDMIANAIVMQFPYQF